MTAIDVTGLTKRYGEHEALRGVDLTVPEDSLFGVLGPNGAGKTTFIRILSGVLRPSGGTIRVLGLDPLKERWELCEQIGYMSQSTALYEDLSARDNVAFFGGAHIREGLAERVEEILQFTDLGDRAGDRAHTFSGGMKSRLLLAAALVHRPRVLFLDEPTAGVDPRLRARLWDLFRRLTAEGVTILISTHLMDEAVLCDRVAILQAGRVIANEPPSSLLERGRVQLAVQECGEVEQFVIGGQPEDLAASLRPFGLRDSVESVKVRSDNLEDVMLRLIEEEGNL
ncbi:MAG: ABC transporter ATP-binding protein [Chloroflexota bacterium]